MSIKRLTKADRPLSFGSFKPVGHVVVALPDDAQADAAVAALLADGFDAEDILQYSTAEEGPSSTPCSAAPAAPAASATSCR
jgi:hypothetical protein